MRNRKGDGEIEEKEGLKSQRNSDKKMEVKRESSENKAENE